MKKLLGLTVGLFISASAMAQPPAPFGPGASCEVQARKMALKRHSQKFSEDGGGLTLTYERFLGEHKFGLTKYEVYLFAGTDAVDGGGWLVTFSSDGSKCRFERSVFLNY